MIHQSIDFTCGNMRIAVIGGGISGIVAAHLIAQKNRVVLFEKQSRLGGHVRTMSVDDGKGGTVPVDMGFSVFNKPNYPVFNRFLNILGVERFPLDMSFVFDDPASGFLYAGTGLRGLFAQGRNLASPMFWKMLVGIRRLGSRARSDLAHGRLAGLTIGEYMDARGYGRQFRDDLLPVAGAVWSAPRGRTRDLPAQALIRFLDTHMLLDFPHKPQWYGVQGGSRTYVQAFAAAFNGEVRTGRPVRSIRRHTHHVEVTTALGPEEFDAVVLATHADLSLKLLADPAPEETRLLSQWSYAPSRVVLHTDPAFVPPHRAPRTSWAFVKGTRKADKTAPGMGCNMHRLHTPAPRKDYIVSHNPTREPQAASVLKDLNLDQARYSLAALDTHKELSRLDGVNRTFFCGAYQGYGFHEDGARSGAKVGVHFGGAL